MHGLVPLSHKNAFECHPSITRGDKYKIITKTFQKPARFNSFFVSISKIYSQLNSNVRNSSVKDFSTLLNCTDLSPFVNVNYLSEFRI